VSEILNQLMPAARVALGIHRPQPGFDRNFSRTDFYDLHVFADVVSGYTPPQNNISGKRGLPTRKSINAFSQAGVGVVPFKSGQPSSNLQLVAGLICISPRAIAHLHKDHSIVMARASSLRQAQ
jgi:hypothetical protein